MATKTSTEVKQELDDLLLEDVPDTTPWTAARKQRAINRAIRSSWPHFKLPKEVTQLPATPATDILLVSQTYAYDLSLLTDIEDVGNGVGIVQALMEPTDDYEDYRQLRNCVQRKDATGWRLYVPEEIVENYAGQILKLRYYARVPALTFAGTDTIPAEFSNYVIYKAAADLFGVFAQGGSDFNVEDMLKLIPLYTGLAQQELKNNTVFCIPMLVGVRQEG